MAEARHELTLFVREHGEQIEAWQVAELHLLEVALRERLAEIGVAVTPDVAAAIMAAATLLVPNTPEFGGDTRCVLGELALLGLALLDDQPT